MVHPPRSIVVSTTGMILAVLLVGCGGYEQDYQETEMLASLQANESITDTNEITLYPPTNVDWRKVLYPGNVLTFDIPLPSHVKGNVTDFRYEFSCTKDAYCSARRCG